MFGVLNIYNTESKILHVSRHKAQQVEHSADNGEADGSNPSMPI